MNIKINIMPLALITVFIAGMLYLFSKTLLNAGFNSLEVGAIRETGTAVMFAIILLVFDRGAFKIKLKDIPAFLLFALFNISSNIAMFTALEYIPLGTASVLQLTCPYFVLVFSFFLFKMKITVRKVIACIVAFTGCSLIVGIFDSSVNGNLIGVALAILSAVTLAAFTIGGRHFGNLGYSENTSMMYFFGFSGLMVLPLVDPGHIYEVLSADPYLIVVILCMCFFSTLVANFLIIYVTRRMDPGVFSILLTLTTVESTLFGIMVFGESITLVGIIGMVLVLIAMVILESDSLVRYLKTKGSGDGTDPPQGGEQ